MVNNHLRRTAEVKNARSLPPLPHMFL